MDYRRLSHVGIVEEPGGVHLGLRGRGAGRERHPAPHANASTGELPPRHSCDTGEEKHARYKGDERGVYIW